MNAEKVNTNLQTLKNQFENICRFCLRNYELHLIEHGNEIISETLFNLTGLDLENNDNLPQKICSNCYHKFNEIYEFGKKCKEAHLCLTQSLNNIQINNDDKLEVQNKKIEEQNKKLLEELNKLQDQENHNLKIEPETPKQYVCKLCSKSYQTSSSLSAHVKKHSGERPFKCDECPKTFFQNFQLKQHKHLHSNVRPFVCSTCSKGFITANKLRQHQLTHSGERPFKCDICMKGFVTSSCLKAHKLVHSDERPFKCEYCSKRYKRKRSHVCKGKNAETKNLEAEDADAKKNVE